MYHFELELLEEVPRAGLVGSAEPGTDEVTELRAVLVALEGAKVEWVIADSDV